MVGAIGELGGAVSVVATLVYLARQVGDASRQDRRNQWTQLAQRTDALRLAAARDPDLSAILMRGVISWDGLNPVERVRFTSWMQAFFDINASMFAFRKEGGIHVVCLGVVIALAADSWWQRREDAARVHASLVAVAAGLRPLRAGARRRLTLPT